MVKEQIFPYCEKALGADLGTQDIAEAIFVPLLPWVPGQLGLGWP